MNIIHSGVVPIYKPLGMTPLETVSIFKEQYPEYKTQTISYAGRLDPMAEGVLLLLIGEANKKRKIYENAPKEYSAKIIFGIDTDTFDTLGIVKKIDKKRALSIGEIKKAVNDFIGKSVQLYPPYSSKPVRGKPLFWWARNNRLSEVQIPSKEIEIFSLEIFGSELVTFSEIVKEISEKIKKVTGDFRQNKILQSWNTCNTKNSNIKMRIVEMNITCSTGTYIRRLASDIGKRLGYGGVVMSLTRTRIGEFTIRDCIILKNSD